MDTTIDHLVRLETEICKAFQSKENVSAVFFDLRNAFDMTWRFKILHILHRNGLRGNLMYFVKNYLSDRKITVRIGNTYSNFKTLENGVPQGGILSPLLFLISINDIAKIIPNPINVYLYADD